MSIQCKIHMIFKDKENTLGTFLPMILTLLCPLGSVVAKTYKTKAYELYLGPNLNKSQL